DKYGMFEIPVGDPFGGPAYGKRQDPMTAMMVATGVSTAMGALSAIQQGRAARAAADFNATISTQNAEIARSDAAAQAAQIERENTLRLGSIRAAQGRSGGAAGEGSVLDVLGDVAAQGELERQYAVYQGEQRARGFTNTAALDRASGRQAERQGFMRAGAELLAGGARAYGSASRLQRTGGATGWTSGYDLMD
ncbi:MAG: hypothetical protein ACK52V_05380, partial [Betaproteobacteria bacterium]